MRSGEMQAIVNDAAQRIAASVECEAYGNKAVDAVYEVETARPLSFDMIASVYAANYEAKLDNSKNNTLLKAAGSVKI